MGSYGRFASIKGMLLPEDFFLHEHSPPREGPPGRKPFREKPCRAQDLPRSQKVFLQGGLSPWRISAREDVPQDEFALGRMTSREDFLLITSARGLSLWRNTSGIDFLLPESTGPPEKRVLKAV